MDFSLLFLVESNFECVLIQGWEHLIHDDNLSFLSAKPNGRFVDSCSRSQTMLLQLKNLVGVGVSAISLTIESYLE